MAAEQVTDALTEHGEGVIWDDVAGRLRWVDMLRGDVLTMDLSTGVVDRLHVAAVAAAIRPRRAGGLVIGVERGFALLSPGATEAGGLPALWSDPTVRMNDGACDPQGRFYCGSMAYDATAGRGTLYRLDPDGGTAVVLADVTISNGLAWTADGDQVLYVDSPTGRIDRFDFDPVTGTLSGRRPFVTLDVGDAIPDGIALDADGGVWVALWGGAAVHRYDASGALAEVVDLPARCVSACAVVDGALFVTTSSQEDPGNPAAGALFRADVGVAGVPVRTFAG